MLDVGGLWVVLLQNNIGYGVFEEHERKTAEAFAKNKNGQLLELSSPCGRIICEGCPPDYGAIWFNDDWQCPIVQGPFYDLADAVGYRDWYGQGGIAIELNCPGDDDGEPHFFEDGLVVIRMRGKQLTARSAGLTPEEAKALMPRCQKCTTSALRARGLARPDTKAANIPLRGVSNGRDR
jgi:hypothetical protein